MLPEEAHWLATTITNCPRAEQILLNRLAKNIMYCVITIYITLHYITLLYTFERFWDFFLVYIYSHGSIICRLVRPSGLPEGLTRWQLLVHFCGYNQRFQNGNWFSQASKSFFKIILTANQFPGRLAHTCNETSAQSVPFWTKPDSRKRFPSMEIMC